MAPVYGFCDANCKQPVYTVNEIITILEQLIQGGSMATINPELLPIVAAIKEQNNNKNINFWLGTEAELNAIDPAVTTKLLMPRIDGENNLYLCSDDTTLEGWKNDVLAAARALVTGYATTEQAQALGINEYKHSSTGELTGAGANGKFKATMSGTYSTITVNGTACAVKCGEESEIELISGVWYTFILDSNTINFRLGGAASKIVLATAEEGNELTVNYTATEKGDFLAVFTCGDRNKHYKTISCSCSNENVKITELSEHYKTRGSADYKYSNMATALYIIKGISIGDVLTFTGVDTDGEKEVPIHLLDIIQLNGNSTVFISAKGVQF